MFSAASDEATSRPLRERSKTSRAVSPRAQGQGGQRPRQVVLERRGGGGVGAGRPAWTLAELPSAELTRWGPAGSFPCNDQCSGSLVDGRASLDVHDVLIAARHGTVVD